MWAHQVRRDLRGRSGGPDLMAMATLIAFGLHVGARVPPFVCPRCVPFSSTVATVDMFLPFEQGSAVGTFADMPAPMSFGLWYVS